jgi:16S rRNA (cytosine1402-N4)-methyltransferase
MNVVNVVPRRALPRSLVEEPHVSVMQREMVSLLQPRAAGVYVDCTLGAGGHTEALLEAGASQVIAIDRDPEAIELAKGRLAHFGGRVLYHQARFSDLGDVLAQVGIDRVDGIMADLGVSSMQIDDAARGMSFRRSGPIDMRMNPGEGETAAEFIERVDADELTQVISELGEERRARRIARCIKQASEAGRLQTTLDLRRAIIRAVGPSRVGGVDPATRSFQALRIAVNEELLEVARLMDVAATHTEPGGYFAVMSFHSLEDRIVKRAMRDRDVWQAVTRKPLVASEDERDMNPRARSAKLRVARRAGGDPQPPQGEQVC